MTTSVPGTVTIGPAADPAGLWTVVRAAVMAGGLGWLPAARLAVEVIGLAGDAGERAVVQLATVRDETGTRVEATVRGGAGGDRFVSVSAGPDRGADPFEDGTFDPLRLLGTTLSIVDQQARQLAAGEAETLEFRAELDETNRGLLAVYAELEAANQRIADLLAMLSHDIRQPLGVITCYSALLLDDWDRIDDDARRRDIRRIASAGTGMTQLVEEFLTLTQLDADGYTVRSAPLDLACAVDDAIAGMSGVTGEAVIVHNRGNHWVLADPRHLHQILTNLLSNAIKYGRPPVEVGAVAVGDCVDVSVRDHGDGVPAEFRPRLFGRFARADTPAARAMRGTGLGLYIVRQLAGVNGGMVTYSDHPDGGGCFTVRLHAAEPPH